MRIEYKSSYNPEEIFQVLNLGVEVVFEHFYKISVVKCESLYAIKSYIGKQTICYVGDLESMFKVVRFLATEGFSSEKLLQLSHPKTGKINILWPKEVKNAKKHS
jgi:hypothetical protein